MDLTGSTDDFKVFNQPSPPKNVSEEMGIQRKPQISLQELLESQPRRGEAGNKGRQWARSGRPSPFLLGPWAQWAGYKGLLAS